MKQTLHMWITWSNKSVFETWRLVLSIPAIFDYFISHYSDMCQVEETQQRLERSWSFFKIKHLSNSDTQSNSNHVILFHSVLYSSKSTDRWLWTTALHWHFSPKDSYQVDVDFGVSQGSSASITGNHSGFDVGHGLLCHQINGKLLVHLDTKEGNLSRLCCWWMFDATSCLYNKLKAEKVVTSAGPVGVVGTALQDWGIVE